MFKYLIVISLIFLVGCSPIEAYRKIVGTSTEALEYHEPRFEKLFDKSYSEAYDQIVDIIKHEFKATIFVEDYYEGRILALHFDKFFTSCIDTTEVGIFIFEPEKDKVRVEVASLNSALGKFVADKLFAELGNN